MKLHIQNGRLIDPANGIDSQKDIYVAEGRILAVTEPGPCQPGFTPDRTINAAGLAICPGLVDLSARLREPGYEYKATLESEMQAAIQGGITSLVCPPDTDPVLDEPGLVEMLKYRARSLYQANVYPLGALTVGLKGEALTEMTELTESGCIGFSQATEPVRDTEMLMRAMQYARTYNYCVWLSPQDAWLGRSGIAHAGPVAARLGLSGIPAIAETISLYTLFELVRQTGVRLHLCRLSTAKGIALVREAKKEGLPVTCDVGVHHIHLTEDDIDFFDPNTRMLPPFRSRADKDAISEGLQDGTIDAVCSDHTPVDDDEKILPFGEATPGATGLELLLPLALKWANEQAKNAPDALAKAIAKITSDPARILKLPCGQLTPDHPADICLFDPAEKWIVAPEMFASQGKHTPFLGKELTGRVVMTLVAGRIAYENKTKLHTN